MALKTIAIKGTELRKEYVANAALSPGHLIELMSTNKVRKHATDAGNASPMFALENDLVGKGIGDAYVASEVVQCGFFQKGSEVLAWLSAGENVVIGAILDSAGDGLLDEYTVPTESTAGVMTPSTISMFGPVCRALEALDLSASGAVATVIKVEIL